MKETSIRIGAVTIGQTPRVDITSDIRSILGPEFEVIERGALDLYDHDYISEHFYPGEGDTVLVSRMRDGRQVKLAEEKILPLLQKCIFDLEQQGCAGILMLCTGRFPEFEHKVMLIRPQEMLQTIVYKLCDGRRIGVILPDREQVPEVTEWWRSTGVDIEPMVASPYMQWDNNAKVAEIYRDKDVAFIFMDCMGYSVKMKKSVREASGKPVMLARTLTARIVRELFE